PRESTGFSRLTELFLLNQCPHFGINTTQIAHRKLLRGQKHHRGPDAVGSGKMDPPVVRTEMYRSRDRLRKAKLKGAAYRWALEYVI
ncbi:MAG TPA: hypothetical protein PLV10_11780, partial [Candidatus Latescibacteria bacterium]|nr:hypothetical protein [Candidatus Latescibacterota bacterium]